MDAVAIGPILPVVGAIAIVVYLGYKLSEPVARDTECHRHG